jgi:hypothetical protein
LLRSRRARALRHLAYALQRNKRLADARQAAAEAADIQRQLLREAPSDASEREQLALTERVVAAASKGNRDPTR